MAQNETSRLERLREKITRRFSDDEFRTLCFNLGIEYHDLAGEGRAGKIRELVAECERQVRLDELERKCAELRPDLGEHSPRLVGVPMRPAVFVGRDDQLADLRVRLTRGGTFALSALNGLPGVGKTTLAVMLAHDEQIQAHFTGGVLWAGLGPNPSVDDVLNRWAEALGSDATGDPTTEARAARVQAALRGRPALVVLDDAWAWEHVAPFRCFSAPGCACLLTTRDETIAQRFAPQQNERVEELPEDQAVELLATLAGQAARLPHDGLLRLARAVGGLPLALMLVGGYLVEHVTFAAEARQAMDVLASAETWLGLADPDRHLTLEQVIALSVDALPEACRQAFAGLAAFAPKPATFSIEAAQAVTGAEAASLGNLARRNLLEKVTPERAAIHPALAAAAARRAGERLPELRQSHAQYYLDWVNQDRNAWQRIEPELEQIRFAWKYVQTLEALQSTPERSEVGETSKVYVLDYVWAMRVFQNMRGLWREYLAWHQRGLTEAQASGNRKTEGTLLNNIAWCYDSLGERRRALEYYEQALPIRREVGDRAGEAQTLNNIGAVYDALGEPRRALEYYEPALPMHREVGNRAMEATTLNNIGAVYDNLGERRRALETYEQALTICREMGDRAGEAVTLNNIASVYYALGKPRRALETYEQALTIMREVGDRAGEATTLNNIGAVYNNLGERRRALETYEQALLIIREVDDRAGEATTLNNIGAVYHAMGEHRRALETYEQVLPIHREVGNRAGEATTLYNMAMVRQAESNYTEAVCLLEQVVAIEEAIEHPDLESDHAALEEARRRAGLSFAPS